MTQPTHGGRREGAGRPPGSRNAATLAREEILAEVCRRAGNAAPSLMPLDVLLMLMREALAAGCIETAINTASIALPYTAARLAPVASVDPNAPTADEIANDSDPEMADDTRL